MLLTDPHKVKADLLIALYVFFTLHGRSKTNVTKLNVYYDSILSKALKVHRVELERVRFIAPVPYFFIQGRLWTLTLFLDVHLALKV